MQCAVLPAIDISKSGVTDADGPLQHARKHRLKITGRTADNLEHFGGGRLLLQRFCEVSRAFAKVVGALAQLVEQPRILDGNDGRGSESVYQCTLLGCK